MAAVGSAATPTARAKTFVEPPGTIASIGESAPAPPDSSPLTTSFTVPSPPCTTTRSTRSSAALAARSAACPRAAVCSTVRSISPAKAWASRSRRRSVVDGGVRVDDQQGVHRSAMLRRVAAGARNQHRCAGTLQGCPGCPIRPAAGRFRIRGTRRRSAFRRRPRCGSPPSWCWSKLRRWSASVLLTLASGISNEANTGQLLAQVAYYLVLAMALAAVAAGLLRGRRWARTPAIVVQLITLGVGFYLAVPSGHPGWGVPVAAVVPGRGVPAGRQGGRANGSSRFPPLFGPDPRRLTSKARSPHRRGRLAERHSMAAEGAAGAAAPAWSAGTWSSRPSGPPRASGRRRCDGSFQSSTDHSTLA